MGELARGREQIVEQWEPLLDADRLTELSWVPEHAEVAASGDLAVTRGHYRITGHVTEEGTGDAKGYYVTVWRRGGDGQWQVVCDVGTPPEA
jgi:ketosteroid isomerase-like protein